MYGVTLDLWQETVLRSAMGERSDSTWAARRVGLSVPRQNGKSQLLVARALAGALLFGERKIVISAHQQDTARESFQKLMDIIEADENASLRERVKSVMNALNREHVKFTNGATVQFKARSGSGSRGFSSDCLMLDEAQILPQRAWVSINSTMSAMPNPQVWLLGTPPTPEDDGEVFGNVRTSAISGASTAVAYLEWSSDPEGDPSDEYTRWSANPAWNFRINHEVVQGEYETYPPDRFALDRLGLWATDQQLAVIPAKVWAARAVANPSVSGQVAYALDMSPDRMLLAIGVAARAGETVHVEVAQHGSCAGGTRWAADWLAARKGPVVVIDARSPAAALVPELKARGVDVVLTGAPDMSAACGALYDSVYAETLSHFDQPVLNLALAGAKKRAISGEGGWGWDRRDGTDITPLVAVTLAAFGLVAKSKKPKTGRAVFA